METHNYENLKVWQKSMDLVELIYLLTKEFPKTEMYGLSSQMKRCAVSIPSNIAEGSRRKTDKDFAQFLSIAFGSGAELETQLILAKRLGFVLHTSQYEKVVQLLHGVMKMLNKFIETISSKV